ncbi:gelsolin, cytoplasmic-like [Bombyx mandarina]|uniref:Gelsolin, cytoplasmic-like n=1 Tax=Bombyx mandarina TaxID=7092 RepID=A0A6J2JR18_BOMMA|nr:gelsolin, cytoplasmic-like [Bombyx mandarina]
MENPVFEEAGNQAGIEIWTIENFEPVPFDPKYYGKFYNGDSYIVLKTTEESSSLTHDAHFWLGSKTTQDKKGSAAIWTITLDDMLGGRAVHHREVQGHESSLFLSYFKPAIRYLEGGNESGFNEVQTNAGAEKRLLKLSGCDNMRIEEVAAEASSLTKNHCFILENEHDIFVLMPEGAKATQRRKIISVANKLRDEEHNGRATIEIIDEFSSDEDVNLFFETLGSGSMDELVSDDTSESYTRSDISAVYLYKVLDGDEQELVSMNKPYKQKHLASDAMYILDTGDTGVYIWLGSDLDAEVKRTYHEIAGKYLEDKGYPSWVHVTRVSEGAESSTFKQYFHNWDTVRTGGSVRGIISEIDSGYFSGDAEESAAAARTIGKSATARGYMPDQGEGSLTVTRISGDQEDVTDRFQQGTSVLYQSEVYVITYKYQNENEEDAWVVYLWIGSEASDDDKEAGQMLLSQLEEDLEGNVTSVKVPQGKESKHFLSIFKGSLIVLFGSKDDDYQPQNSKKSYEEDQTRLFRVEGTETGVDMRAVQVAEESNVLEDDDVFVLETGSGVYVWNGKDSDPQEQEAALKFVENVVKDKDVTVVEQGDEPEEFWEALGGIPEEKEEPSAWRMVVNRRVTATRTLTAVSVGVAGRVKFEDLDTEFSQQDLSEDGVYILDTGEELYFWQGADVTERVKSSKQEVIKKYIEDDGLDRTVDSAVVVTVRQGAEPRVFKKLFPDWDDGMWSKLSSYEDMKNSTKAANSK